MPITFDIGNNQTFVNATEMAKPFGKRPSEFLRLSSTGEFLVKLSDVRKSHITNLVKTVKGNSSAITQGTWMHEDIALEYARWLSPEFKIWCNDRIKELLVNGKTSLTPTNEDDTILRALNILNTRIEAKDQQIQLQKHSLKEQAPKVQYFDEVLQSVQTYNATTIAKELGMSANELNGKLKEMKVQYYADKHWVLTSKYQNQGYTKTKTYSFTNSSSQQMTNINTVWTEKGRNFIHNLIKGNKTA